MEPIQIAIVVVFGALMLFAITFISKKTSPLDRAYYKKRWQRIRSSQSQGEAGMRLAVIDADKLLDHAFKASRVRGSTMGERLKSSRATLANSYDDIWEAHKLRNRLVHEDTNLKVNEVKYALRAFEQGLKKLGAL